MAPELGRRLTATSAPGPAAADDGERLTLLFAGDVMLGRLVDEVLRERPPASVWGDTLPLFAAADLRICNLECAVSDIEDPSAWPDKAFHFRSAERNVAALRAAGIGIVSLANNHALDAGEAALVRTLDVLDAAGIAHAGAGRTLDEARAVAIRSVRGCSVGVVAFTDNEPGWAAGPRRPGVFHVDVGADDPEWDDLLDVVRGTRDAVDVLVASAHWGPNWGDDPLSGQVRLAHALVDAGVDIVFGHSGHVVRGVACHRGRPILYCAGDYIDDYAVDPIDRNDHSAIFLVDVVAGGIATVRVHPTVIRDFGAWLATGAEQDEILGRIARLSAALGTDATVDRERGTLTVDMNALQMPATAGPTGAAGRGVAR